MSIAMGTAEIDPLVSVRRIEADPVISFAEIKTDLGCSHTTFYRVIRDRLPVVQISPRRLGVRRSDYERFKASLVRQPNQAA